ncbi:hypothetical protein CB1_001006008 [Camelus ferus]|nr:hypothetical protein CB1_001006008 [Camelus ferus]
MEISCPRLQQKLSLLSSSKSVLKPFPVLVCSISISGKEEAAKISFPLAPTDIQAWHMEGGKIQRMWMEWMQIFSDGRNREEHGNAPLPSHADPLNPALL